MCVYRCACTVALEDVRGKNKKAEVSILELIYDSQSDDPVTPRTLCSTTAPRCHIIHQGHHKYGERGCHTTKKFSGSYPARPAGKDGRRGSYNPGLIYICENNRALSNRGQVVAACCIP